MADCASNGDVPIRIRLVAGDPLVDSTKTFFTPLTQVDVGYSAPTAPEVANTAMG
jgi:hypothetical protein